MPRRSKKTGRKPEGLGKHGEPKRIRDYPTLLVTIRPSVKAVWDHLAAREDRPKWKIVEDAVRLYQKTQRRASKRTAAHIR
jgi:hypothetical protein